MSPRKANAAIYYHREAFTTDLSKVMGRNAAGESFLTGFAKHADVDRFICYARDSQDSDHFRIRVGLHSGRECAWVPHGNLTDLSSVGALFVFSPQIGEFCWQRRSVGDAAWSVIGLTHTVSTDRVMEDIGDLLVAPTQPWDALICISKAVKQTVEGVLERWSAYLAERFGTHANDTRPRFPVIPLGIDCDAFRPNEKLRQQFRQKHGIGNEEVVFLFLGRLSFHAKAHPLPMYLALEAATGRSRQKLVLLLCGSFFNEDVQRSFFDGASRYCPSVRVIHIDSRKAEERAGAWAGSDIFTSLSDNIQESFGLAPVEAMAAGLPAVVSDWNGYRDTVVDGETGFLIPTATPEPGGGAEFALRYLAWIDSYDQYVGLTSQCTSVDVPAATDAYLRLIEDRTLRKRLGEAGRERARRLFDWQAIVPRYQELWGELEQARRTAAPIKSSVYPLRDDPFCTFRTYPTFQVGSQTWLEVVAKDPRAETQRIAMSVMNTFALPFMLRVDELDRVFEMLSQKGRIRVGELHAILPQTRQPALMRTLLWLAKGNVVRLRR